MTVTAPTFELETPAAALRVGRVRLHGEEAFTIGLEGGGDCRARRAASCLLLPRTGDRVLVAIAPEPFVLAVLDRDAAKEAELVVEGDAVLRTRGGRLDLDADRGMRLRTPSAIEMTSPRFRLASGAVELVSEELAAVARFAKGTFGEASLVATSVERVAERVVEKASRVFRFVSEFEQLRARHFDYRADGTAQLKGNQTVVVAREVVRVDGAQVHIG